ncbi:SGNH hydrolase-type esterase domain-containing protein [Macrophomina phaseolina]|uniref:SGNH hydrolase-type esterase domain-containing protein n=1 Tax=Macrophomina phaseolina TaxID=35725 RepID=A0ABQ8GDX6_9PEZI|nr:SGNH hydrolase-type esterase domain-containing protein [Macrophomina phaseolina]
MVYGLPGHMYVGDRLETRQGPLTGLDVKDLEWIQKWAAIGDSYSAGIGAGAHLRDSGKCSRYDNSYPMMLQRYEMMPDPAPAMEYLSCSGYTSPQILDEQVSKLGTGYDLITVSSGGNDVELSKVLNHCVFQWWSGGDQDCEDQLTRTADLINSTLPGNLDALAAGLKGKTNTLRKVFWTGYARFFDDTTADCDGVSWAFWYNGKSKQRLTQARRARMNELTVAVNHAIRDAVSRAGDGFVFVDYDQYYEMLGGRFCEPGVKEPAANRFGLLFYEWDTEDGALVLPSTKRDLASALEVEASELENVFQARDLDATTSDLEARQTSGGSGGGNATSFEDEIANWIVQAKSENSTLEVSLPDHSGADPAYRGRASLSVSDFVSDGIKRVFHPRPGGHALIANLLIWHLASQQANSPDGPGGFRDEIGPAQNEGCTLAPTLTPSSVVATISSTATAEAAI